MAYGQTAGWLEIYEQGSHNKNWKHVSIPHFKERGF